MKAFKLIFDTFIDFVFPQFCIICFHPAPWLCKECFKDSRKALPECFECRRLNNNFKTHSNCESDLSKSIFLFKYDNNAKQLMIHLKLKSCFEIATVLRRLANESPIASTLLGKEISFVPIPITTNKRKERGFNQVEEIFKEILNERLFTDVLFIHNKFKNQSDSSKSERVNSNFKFEVNPSYINSIKSTKELCLLDDVITTGTTLRRAARAIKKINPSIKIYSFAFFRGKAYWDDNPSILLSKEI